MSILKDGYKVTITLGGPGANLYGEIEITPPEIDGRGGIDMTSMRNLAWVTMAPKSLKQLNPVNAKLMFDPSLIPAVYARVQRNTLFTITFPDGATLTFWGWIDKMTHDPLKESERPTLTVVIQPSNLNSQCQEAGPVFTAGTAAVCA
jgi:hypothetical protein